MSSLYETAPVGGPEQGEYLNAVVLVDTALGARTLLEQCLAVERERGRVRSDRWGPRSLDLDLLLYGADRIQEPGLTVPHPRLAERRFVLEPLGEVWRGPLPDGTSISDALCAVADQRLRRVAGPRWARRTRAIDAPAAAALALAGVGLLALALRRAARPRRR